MLRFCRLFALGGILATVGVAVSNSKTPILTYHDFIQRRDAKSLWFDCTPLEFEAQIQWLIRHNARFVSLQDVYEHLTQHRALPPHAVAITAADGYEGFYLRAVPIIQKYRIPVTMFVHTKFVGGRQGRPKMSWEQLKSLEEGGLVSIESQTVSHPEDLRTLNDQELAAEMVTSKRTLETKLSKRVSYVAYPNGKFDERCEMAAQAAGYRMAFSEVTKPCEKSPNRWAVNRYVHTKWKKAWMDSYGGR